MIHIGGSVISITVCAISTVVFDNRDTKDQCKPLSTALHHHLPQMFNL